MTIAVPAALNAPDTAMAAGVDSRGKKDFMTPSKPWIWEKPRKNIAQSRTARNCGLTGRPASWAIPVARCRVPCAGSCRPSSPAARPIEASCPGVEGSRAAVKWRVRNERTPIADREFWSSSVVRIVHLLLDICHHVVRPRGCRKTAPIGNVGDGRGNVGRDLADPRQ